jgi:hypothetical protein
MLVHLRWLDDGKAGDDREVGSAVRRLLIEAANALPSKKP